MFFFFKTPSQVQLELAKRFKDIRKSKKISQSELAQKSGVSLGSIKRFELTGQISLESLLKLSQYVDRMDEFDMIFKAGEDMKEIKKLFT